MKNTLGKKYEMMFYVKMYQFISDSNNKLYNEIYFLKICIGVYCNL